MSKEQELKEMLKLYSKQDLWNRIKEKQATIYELEAKLAEKERQLKLAEELLIKREKEYDEQLEKQSKIHYRHLKEKDQDKISFTIEQLEKVKNNIENADNNNDIYIRVNDFEVIDEIFYKQIKELKEGK